MNSDKTTCTRHSARINITATAINTEFMRKTLVNAKGISASNGLPCQ